MLNQQTRRDPQPAISVQIDESLKDLIPGFLENRKKDVEKIRLALEQADFSAIQTLGHRMKGDGGGYGFDRITEIGGAMELAAARRDHLALDRHTAELEDFLARVDVVYR